MPWWVAPVVLGLVFVGLGVLLIMRGRRIAASGERDHAVRAAMLTVLGTMLVTSGCTAAAVVAMLSYALR